MPIVKQIGTTMVLAREGDKFWLIRCKEERSQDFKTEQEVWTTLRSGRVRWHKL